MNTKNKLLMIVTAVFITGLLLTFPLQHTSIKQTQIQQKTSMGSSLFISAVNPCSNQPPKKPSQPTPGNNSLNVSIQPVLRVLVMDPDNNTMNVSFYNGANDNLISKVNNIHNGSTAETIWANRSYNTTYSWYAVANDSHLQNKSQVWKFTTLHQPPGTFSITLRKQGVGIHAIINNTGNTIIKNLTWTMSITSKRQIIRPINSTRHGIITLPTHNETILKSLPKGFCRIHISITAKYPESQVQTHTADGILLRYRVLLFSTT